MSRLSAFLNPVQTEETREVVVSDRFVDESGQPVPFTIRSITQTQNEKIIKACTRRGKDHSEVFDKVAYNQKLVLASVVEPQLDNAELCQKYGVVDPADVAGAMLYSGEYAKLMTAIMDLNGFQDDDNEEAKNS